MSGYRTGVTRDGVDEPATGAGSEAGAPRPANFWGRRVVALVIDWLASWSIAFVFFRDSALATLLIFAGSTFIFQATLGTTLGHWIMGVGTRTADGSVPGFARAALRTFTLCLLLPPVITDTQGRGMHERWSGTHVVPLRRIG